LRDREATFKETSIANLTESDLVDELLADPVWRSRIVGQKGIPDDARAFTRVPLTDVPGGHRGDIDLLLCAPNRPDAAIAIEVKRIKVGIRALRDGKPNKLGELEEGIRQSNLLADIGFSQVYFYVFVAVDSREKTLNAPEAWAGPSPELRQLLHDKISPFGLLQRVGMFKHQFIQPLDERPLGVGSYSGHLVRLSEAVQQPRGLTEWIADRMETLKPLSARYHLDRVQGAPERESPDR
jgi:hypothetical protein